MPTTVGALTRRAAELTALRISPTLRESAEARAATPSRRATAGGAPSSQAVATAGATGHRLAQLLARSGRGFLAFPEAAKDSGALHSDAVGALFGCLLGSQSCADPVGDLLEWNACLPPRPGGLHRGRPV